MAGLRLRHLDFTHGRIVIEDGKTHGSVREVHMSPFLREELLLYVAELKLTGPDDLLFPTKRGTPRSRQNLNRRVLAPAVARAAQARAARGDSVLPPAITPHTLRRTFVTLSAQAGRSASWVQAQIGHADMTTMQRYYLQASRSEIQPRIKRLIEYLLGEAGRDGVGRPRRRIDGREAKTDEATATRKRATRPSVPGDSRQFRHKIALSRVLVPEIRLSPQAAAEAKYQRVCSYFRDGETRTRTGDTTIFSRVLYQLSYLAAARERLARRPPTPCRSGSGSIGWAAGRAPAARPDLEVQVRAVDVAGLADLRDRLAGGHRVALRDEHRSREEVHEHEVAAADGAHHEVVAGAGGLIGAHVDGAGPGRHDRRALRGEDVLALVDVAVAGGAEAALGAAERPGALHAGTRRPLARAGAGRPRGRARSPTRGPCAAVVGRRGRRRAARRRSDRGRACRPRAPTGR